MGETLLLLSCEPRRGGKPIRLARPWALPRFFQRDRGGIDPSTGEGGRELVVKEIDAETVLEKCRALIKQIITDLSAEKPFVNASSAAALLLHLEAAAAALKRSFGPRPPEH
jgi:hypothetical protein